MAGSITLLVVGVMLLTGGEWHIGYGIACIAAGAVWWHVSEHARRARLERDAALAVSPRLARSRKAVAAIAATLEALGVLIAGGGAFDHASQSLFDGFSGAALLAGAVGVGMVVAASQLNALKRRLNEDTLAVWAQAWRLTSRVR